MSFGRAMAQAVSRRPLTAEALVRSRVSTFVICGGQSGTGAGLSPSASVFPCQFHSTGASLLGKPKETLIVFIRGLHNKPQGCGASVASAAGPFTTKSASFSLLLTCFYLCHPPFVASAPYRTSVTSALQISKFRRSMFGPVTPIFIYFNPPA